MIVAVKDRDISAEPHRTGFAGARARRSWAEVSKRFSLPGLLGLLGGLGVSIGAWLPWMSLYAGLVTGAAIWLFIGVWQVSHGRGASAMLVPRPGPGLFVVALGGLLLALAAFVPEGFKGPAVT